MGENEADREPEDDQQAIPRLRAILSANVRALIDDARKARPELGSILKVATERQKATHGTTRLSKSRIGRVVKGSHPTDVDALDELAEAFGLQPWQLLVENLNPKALPRLVDSEFLSQLKQIVDKVPEQKQDVLPSPVDEQQVKRKTEGDSLGPALRRAFNAGSNKNAGSKPSRLQKPKGGRGR